MVRHNAVMRMSLANILLGEEAVTTDHTWQDSTSREHAEQAHPQTQEVGHFWSGAGTRDWEGTTPGDQVSAGGDDSLLCPDGGGSRTAL